MAAPQPITKSASLPTCLLVDDDPAFVDLCRKLCSAWVKLSGINSLDQIELELEQDPNPYDYMIFDFQIMGRTGWEVYESLKKRDAHKYGTSRVLFLTGLDIDAPQLDILRKQAVPFAQKPSSLAEFRALFRRLFADVKKA